MYLYDKEIHEQQMKNGTISCEVASYINRSNSPSFTCPEPIIKIHTRVIAYYAWFYCCLLPQMMNEAKINAIDFFLKQPIMWETAINF